MPACIFFHPEGYSTQNDKLMGRHAAGASFLEGFFRYANPCAQFFVQVENQAHADQFEALSLSYSRTEKIEVITQNVLGRLSEAETLYIPGPTLGKSATERSFYNDAAWSLCGVTHTTSSAGAMDQIAQLLTSSVQPWDALICTSIAVKKNVEAILQAQANYLKERLSIAKLVLPQLPIIPLGVHVKDFEFSESQRLLARERLKVSTEDLVVLYVGRLSFHAKAHPLAMYKSLEIAAKQTGKNVTLVECGWHANEYIENAFSDAAKQLCPSVRVVALDGRLASERETAWASADVFCSFSDNIQETFGIVPLEAMSAGLPVVVSDWDGYKDTVRHGVDGYRIPTLASPPGSAGDLAQRHALGIDTYDMYCGHSSSLISVDIGEAANAFSALFESAELRKTMGDAGYHRVIDAYDWRSIIPRYEDLWDELGERRKAAVSGTKTPPKHPWPARLDPSVSFQHYPTAHLSPDSMLKLVDQNVESSMAHLESLKKLSMINYAGYVIPKDAELAKILSNASSGPKRPEDLMNGIEPTRKARVFRALVWLHKIGILTSV